MAMGLKVGVRDSYCLGFRVWGLWLGLELVGFRSLGIGVWVKLGSKGSSRVPCEKGIGV